MKVLITGARGMVGSNLVEKAKELPQFSLLTPTRDELDLRDFGATLSYFQRNTPDIIIHSAGRVGGIQANIREPVSFLVDNMDMGRNVVLAAQQVGIPRLLNLGSSCMYPRNHEEPMPESLVMKGELEPTNEGYALAKIMTARLSDYVTRENDQLEYKTAIPCNLYGRYDKFSPEHSHLIPAIIHKMHQAIATGQSEVEIWGDGTVRREFMYAEDLAEFVFYALDNFESMPSYLNVGLGEDYFINDYYQTVAEVMEYRGSFTHDVTKPVGMKRKMVDISLLKDFGWRHRFSLREGLRNTIDFYRKNWVS